MQIVKAQIKVVKVSSKSLVCLSNSPKYKTLLSCAIKKLSNIAVDIIALMNSFSLIVYISNYYVTDIN